MVDECRETRIHGLKNTVREAYLDVGRRRNTVSGGKQCLLLSKTWIRTARSISIAMRGSAVSKRTLVNIPGEDCIVGGELKPQLRASKRKA